MAFHTSGKIGLLALACFAIPSVASAADLYSFELKNTCVDDSVTVSIIQKDGKKEVAKLTSAQNTYINLDKHIPASDENVTLEISEYNIAGPSCNNFKLKRVLKHPEDARFSETLYLQDDGRLGAESHEIKNAGSWMVGNLSNFKINLNRATGAVQVMQK